MHPLVILPGALLPPSTSLVERLGRRRRVLVLSHPDATGMTALVDELAAALERFGIDHCDVLGFSYGGWVAQCLSRRYPALVRDLVLAHSFAIRPTHAWRFRLGLKIWQWLPDRVFARLALARVAKVLSPLRRRSAADADHALGEVRAALDRPGTRAELERQNRCLLDSCSSFGHVSEAQRHPGRRLLIIESDNDPAVRWRERAWLRALYPDAHVRTFNGTGHITALAEPHAFVDAVDGFLDR